MAEYLTLIRILGTILATGIFSFIGMVIYRDLFPWKEIPNVWAAITGLLMAVPLMAFIYLGIWLGF